MRKSLRKFSPGALTARRASFRSAILSVPIRKKVSAAAALAGIRRGGIGYRPHIQADIRLDDVLVNMPTIPELSEGSSNYGLDVKVTLGPDIHLYNKYLYDLWLSGGLHVTGSTVYTNIDGNVKVDKGTITYLRTPFEIHNASVAWPVPGDVLPTVNLDATTRFRRYDIFLLRGRLSRWK